MGHILNKLTLRFWGKLAFLPIGVFFFLDDKQRPSVLFFSNIAILNLPKTLYTIPINFLRSYQFLRKIYGLRRHYEKSGISW